MGKYKYDEDEQKFNNVLTFQRKELESIEKLDLTNIDKRIKESEALLESLGYSIENIDIQEKNNEKKVIKVPKWDELCAIAEKEVGNNNELEALFTPEELKQNSQIIKQLNDDYNAVHRLDKIDIAICVSAGLMGAIVDILLVGIPTKTKAGVKGGPLENYVRDWFDKKFPQDKISQLENQAKSKTPFDAQDNRYTQEYVEGLSSWYHRLLSLGHDPLLGFIVGVFDIMTGRMTTIDKSGKIVSQVMENYASRKESNIFAAIAKEFTHLMSDVNTSAGLPVPLMALFNLMQFGSIGEEELTIAEIVQGMYAEGYDFIHFCTMSIPTIIVEVISRIGYAIKRVKEGNQIKDSIPFSLDREKNPKLATMLFISHSIAAAVNAGKVLFTRKPESINYPQWIMFARYSYKQLMWSMIKKPKLRDLYVNGTIYDQLEEIYTDIDIRFDQMSSQYEIIV